MPVTNEKIAVIGAGAVGTYLAWNLLRAGQDVIVCTRRAVPSLSVRTGASAAGASAAGASAADNGAGDNGAGDNGAGDNGAGDNGAGDNGAGDNGAGDNGAGDSIPVRSVTEPSALPRLDWVLVATKAQDTGSVGPWLEAGTGPGTVIVLLQNGIDHADRLGPLAAGRTVLPALVHINLQPLRPGQVWHRTGHQISVPAGPEGERLARLFAGTEIAIRHETDFAAAAWRKLLHNSAHNPILALTGRRADVFADPDVRELARRLIFEAAAVAAARGVMLTEQDTEKIVAALGDLPPDAGNSMLFDRLRGRALEWEYITGAIVRAGRDTGVPTPLHEAVLALLRAISAGPTSPLPDAGVPLPDVAGAPGPA